jgi:hypothetical protein
MVLLSGQRPYAQDAVSDTKEREVSSPFVSDCQVRSRRQALGAGWSVGLTAGNDRDILQSPRFGRGFDLHRPCCS